MPMVVISTSMYTINCSPLSNVVTKNPTCSPWFTYGMRNVRAIQDCNSCLLMMLWLHCCPSTTSLSVLISSRAVPSVIDIHILWGGQNLVRSGSGNLPLSGRYSSSEETFELREEREKEPTVNISCFHSFRVKKENLFKTTK